MILSSKQVIITFVFCIHYAHYKENIFETFAKKVSIEERKIIRKKPNKVCHFAKKKKAKNNEHKRRQQEEKTEKIENINKTAIASIAS